MATYTQVKSGWRAQIRRKGHQSIARTFDTKADAERWALTIESKMGIGTYVDNRESLSTTLFECLDRYEREIIPHKKGAERDLYRVKLWQRDPLSAKGIGTIRQVDIAKWRDARLAFVSGSTAKKDLALLSHVFTIASQEWGFPLTNPVAMIRKPKSGLSRDRRLHPGEESLLLENCDTVEMRSFIILAIETAMRRGEIIGLKRPWIKGRIAYLPDTKNGTARAVPLSVMALDAIAALPIRIDGRLFGFKVDAYTKSFIRICSKSGIENLHVHDLRHEATSRLFEKGLDVMQVKSITGHKSLQMLSRYTHFQANELAKLLG